MCEKLTSIKNFYTSPWKETTHGSKCWVIMSIVATTLLCSYFLKVDGLLSDKRWNRIAQIGAVSSLVIATMCTLFATLFRYSMPPMEEQRARGHAHNSSSVGSFSSVDDQTTEEWKEMLRAEYRANNYMAVDAVLNGAPWDDLGRPLPAGWLLIPNDGNPYYWHAMNSNSTWDRPVG